ncbi:glycosyltransferase [Alienimonas sp. DA493]|uniref:CgeB family protein n=1 Tax=Alienimonas sp. DA493 TaxID=3373605 RepID=UPI0037543287
MRLVVFTHSVASDWNHGNAHFLRGVARALHARGHAVETFEPSDGWSLQNLLTDHGLAPLSEYREVFPDLPAKFYDPEARRFDGEPLDAVLDRADAVLVHEWNAPEFVARLGKRRRERGGFRLLFHDTHHRAASAPEAMRKFDLSGYDGVLAFGEVIRELYLRNGWTDRAWTWHEAADTTLFNPPAEPTEPERDLVWVGNWGDGERTAELREFLLEPIGRLGLSARVHGVRYPAAAREALAEAGAEYAGWLPNHRVPAAFAQARATVHVPRRPYVEALPGVPTIRPFEALACGLPLVCSPWEDAEGLFRPGRDYLLARDGEEMQRHLRAVLEDDALAANLREHGRETILARHTCGHRADELLTILDELGTGGL